MLPRNIIFFGMILIPLPTKAPTQATKNVNKTFRNVLFWLEKKCFVFMFLKRFFNVFAETKPPKIGLILVSKSTFLEQCF